MPTIDTGEHNRQFAEIRKLIDEQHHSAVEALWTAQASLSKRARVLACVAVSAATARQIARATGLTRRQVTGVLYSADVRDKVARTRDSEGRIAFAWRAVASH